MMYQGKAQHAVREVILHCAAIKTGQFDGMSAADVHAEVSRWHKLRGFKSFGYHGLFMPDGGFYRGRPYDQIGAHTMGHNAGTIGLLLIESREITRVGAFDDWFTVEQRAALGALLRAMRDRLGIEKFSGHNDYGPKLCPGFWVHTKEWL